MKVAHFCVAACAGRVPEWLVLLLLVLLVAFRILVNMENRMVECFENEDDLVVRFEQDKAAGGYTLYLSY